MGDMGRYGAHGGLDVALRERPDEGERVLLVRVRVRVRVRVS